MDHLLLQTEIGLNELAPLKRDFETGNSNAKFLLVKTENKKGCISGIPLRLFLYIFSRSVAVAQNVKTSFRFR
jgi:hypothetical protein